MSDIVGHLDPHGIATQTDQGQKKLEDQDGCPHYGTDHKDDGHRNLLAESLRNCAGISPADEIYWVFDPLAAKKPRFPRLKVLSL
jgi:hypothetical protein